MNTHKNTSRLSDTHYPTKKDLWLVVLLVGLFLFFLYAPVIIISKPVHILVKIFGSLFFLAMSLFTISILVSISYILTDEHLIIRCLGKNHPISLADIYEVFPTHNPLSSPALSLDRIRIKFRGSWFGALISPKDKQVFMNDLLSRCPQLIRQGEKLVEKRDTGPIASADAEKRMR